MLVASAGLVNKDCKIFGDSGGQ
ncbi:hypothetical protein Tco_0659564, partial [Tanacetum coccineum]